MTIRAVLFDLDDTLIDDHGSTQESIARTVAKVASRCDGLKEEDLAEAYWGESDGVWTEFGLEQLKGRKQEEGSGQRLRRESWRRALLRCDMGDEALTELAVAEYGRQRRATLRLAPGADEVLQELRGSVRTAIITNGTTEIQREKMRICDLERRVDYSIVAEEFGFGKPHPGIFLHVAEILGIKPEECIVVGDLIALDIVGAQAAGMRSVWINRDFCAPPSHGPRPDHVIADLRQVLDIVLGARESQ
jgi:putative hydrolase of the HAD superfamily